MLQVSRFRNLPTTRSHDGTSNNLIHPRWGSVGEQFRRTTTVAYADGIAAPAGPDRPSARVVSNSICKHEGSRLNRHSLSDLFWVWGQFLSHELHIFRPAEPEEHFNIPVSADDPFFPSNSVIPFARSAFDISTGHNSAHPREQINMVTSYIDGSNIYGSDPTRGAVLRTFKGGCLRTSAGHLLPLNTVGLPNHTIDTSGHPHDAVADSFFLAGDVRANLGLGLCSLHTLFVREHNRLAAELSTALPDQGDEQIYQRARKLVGAEIQAITYNQFLPKLLGPATLGQYHGYDPTINATTSALFFTVGFRFGHSMLSPQLLLVYDDGEVRVLPHRKVFFNIGIVKREGIEPILKGLTSQVMQEVNTRVIDDVRNLALRIPGAPKLDLVATDIQRARDHGIPDYNQVRKDVGLEPIRKFSDLTSDRVMERNLQVVYEDISRIDPLVGALAEAHMHDGELGELLTTVVSEQFDRLRAGDRFWYEHDPMLSREEIGCLQRTTLADVIRRNTTLTNIQDDVFTAAPAL